MTNLCARRRESLLGLSRVWCITPPGQLLPRVARVSLPHHPVRWHVANQVRVPLHSRILRPLATRLRVRAYGGTVGGTE